MTRLPPPRRGLARGFSMIEVLVALVVTLIGLFAMLGLNLRAFQTESESYQRSQALVLVEDMAQRIRSNRTALADYAVDDSDPAGASAEVCAALTGAARDLCEWGNLLRGAAETDGGGRQIGAMADARGCVTVAAPAGGASGSSTANVVVVWRGATPSATPASAPCVPSGFSVSDGYMRTTSSVVRFGDLDGN
jgi:type IV pilus assembly protein PilV